jgi:uncharacterized protein involved in type VI secretion and phage assembly
MPYTLFESGAKEEEKSGKAPYTITAGTVSNNVDLVNQGKILVRLPSLDQEVWARLTAIGAGPDAGFFYVPRSNDEVLVALNDSDPNDAFVLGGLWSTKDSPPVSDQLQATTKRVIKTGITAGVGHEVEFDDGPGQSITITTSTKQKIVLDTETIELSTTGGSVSITLDLKTQKVSIQAPQIEIGGSKTASLKLNAAKVEINGTATTTIKGGVVNIN